MPEIDADALCADYLDRVTALMRSILDEERASLDAAAARLADQIAADRLIHVFGPGGHSNLAAQEIFFRAGGLMHVAAILDEGTLLSNGALRSMAIERTPGYGRVVIADRRLGRGRPPDPRQRLRHQRRPHRRGARGEAARRVHDRRQLAPRTRTRPRPTIPPATRPSRTCTTSSTSRSTPRCRSATRVMRLPGLGEPIAAALDLRQRLRAQLPRHPHRREARRARRRAAGLAQRQRARRRRGQRPLPRTASATACAPCDGAASITGRDPASGRSARGRARGRPHRRDRRRAAGRDGLPRPPA